MKSPIGNLIGLAWNLCIALGSIVIFTAWSYRFALDPSLCVILHVPSRSGASVSPHPWGFCTQAPPAFKIWVFLLLTPDPQVSLRGFRILTLVGELQQYNCFPVWESPTWRIWDLIMLWKHPSHCLIVTSLCFECEVFFFINSSGFVCVYDGYSYDFGVFWRGHEFELRSFYFFIFSQIEGCFRLDACCLFSVCWPVSPRCGVCGHSSPSALGAAGSAQSLPAVSRAAPAAHAPGLAGAKRCACSRTSQSQPVFTSGAHNGGGNFEEDI